MDLFGLVFKFIFSFLLKYKINTCYSNQLLSGLLHGYLVFIYCHSNDFSLQLNCHYLWINTNIPSKHQRPRSLELREPKTLLPLKKPWNTKPELKIFGVADVEQHPTEAVWQRASSHFTSQQNLNMYFRASSYTDTDHNCLAIRNKHVTIQQ